MIYTDLIFIYAFLPIAVILTMLDRSVEYKNFILVIASLVFFSWGKPVYVCLIFLSAVFDWIFGLIAGSRARGFKFLGAGLSLVMNAAIFVFVQWNFLFAGTPLSVERSVLPLGIAFYTVRGMSYVFDTALGKNPPEKNVFCFLTYMINYTLLLVGPFVRYREMEGQIRHRMITGRKINDGITRFIVGLGKTAVLAGALGYVKSAGLDLTDMTFFGAVIGMAAFIAQVYFLFSGYTDMAIGLGLLNGFTCFGESFLPLKPKDGVTGAVFGFNHSLVKVVNDCFISPLSKSPVSAFFATLACSALVGLWYGFGKQYAVFGLFFGVLIIIETLFLRKLIKKLLSAITAVYILIAVFFGWSIVYFGSLSSYKIWLSALSFKYGLISDGLVGELLSYCALLVFAVFLLTPFKDMLKCAINSWAMSGEKAYSTVRLLSTAGLIIILLMSTASKVVY